MNLNHANMVVEQKQLTITKFDCIISDFQCNRFIIYFSYPQRKNLKHLSHVISLPISTHF